MTLSGLLVTLLVIALVLGCLYIIWLALFRRPVVVRQGKYQEVMTHFNAPRKRGKTSKALAKLKSLKKKRRR